MIKVTFLKEDEFGRILVRFFVDAIFLNRLFSTIDCDVEYEQYND